MLAETPFPRTPLAFDKGTVDGDVLLSTDFKCPAISAEVDGVTTTARRFTTNRAVTAVEWVGVMGFHTERNCLAMA